MERSSSLWLGWALGLQEPQKRLAVESHQQNPAQGSNAAIHAGGDGLSPKPCPLEPGFPFPILPSFRPPLVCVARLRPDGKIPKDV